MSKLFTPARAVLVALVVSTAATSGCSWFRSGTGVYSGPAESRPLELPPVFDPATASAADGASVTASGTVARAQPAEPTTAFTVPGARDDVYARLGEVLAGIDGVVITSRAQLLGAYDVTYGDTAVLVRVTEGTEGAVVSLLDPRGLPVSGDAARRLIERLRAGLGS